MEGLGRFLNFEVPGIYWEIGTKIGNIGGRPYVVDKNRKTWSASEEEAAAEGSPLRYHVKETLCWPFMVVWGTTLGRGKNGFPTTLCRVGSNLGSYTYRLPGDWDGPRSSVFLLWVFVLLLYLFFSFSFYSQSGEKWVRNTIGVLISTLNPSGRK